MTGSLDVGFTGTRYGTTWDQHKAMCREISRAQIGSFDARFHHGGCTGSDAQAHDVAWSLGYSIVLHPPTGTKLRAWVEQSEYWDDRLDIVLPARPYIERNHDIVDVVSVLIATPDGPERERSGTWSTVRYARSKNVPTIIIMPDGDAVKE